jgi:hypothetical protein
MKAPAIHIVIKPFVDSMSVLPMVASYGPWNWSIFVSKSPDTKDFTMALPKRYAKKQAKAKRRDRLNAKARHLRQQQDAQRTIDALHQALHDLGLPEHLVVEIEGRLKAQKKLLSKVLGLCFPLSLVAPAPMNSPECADGIRICPLVCWALCPNGPGSNGCASLAKTSWSLYGATSSL